MKNISENQVILTDEKYKSVRSNLVIWYTCLVIKLALIALLILEFTHLEWFIIPLKWFTSIVPFSNMASFCFIFLAIICGTAGLILSYALLVACNIVHELQTTSQNSVDDDFLDEINYWRFLEIFPGKGIRLALREVHRYRRQKKLQKKEYKEKQ